MRKSGWSLSVFLRYALWQLPGLAVFVTTVLLILHWASLPRWLIWIGVALWMIKDCFFFPRVWRAYDRDPTRAAHSMVGKIGIVETRLDPSGLVRVHGEIWRAEVGRDRPPMGSGETVRIEEVRGLTLIVGRNQDERKGGSQAFESGRADAVRPV